MDIKAESERRVLKRWVPLSPLSPLFPPTFYLQTPFFWGHRGVEKSPVSHAGLLCRGPWERDGLWGKLR